MKFEDYYETMGVPRDVDDAALKKQYRRLARKYHPDVSTEANAEERFKAIGEAYEVLKDPEKRAAYDQLGADWQAGQDFRPPPGWAAHGSPFGEPSDYANGFAGPGFEFDDFSDFFHSIFGQTPGGGQARSGARAGPGRARDAHARLAITLEELYSGTPVALTLMDRHTGTERRLLVTVPKHVREGQSFRLPGQGGAGGPGEPAGDLYVELRVVPHPEFEVRGNDIHSTVTVAPWEAVLGTQVSVNTLGGRIKLTVPEGSRSGTRLRLKNRGLAGSEQGHHFVSLTVQVPEHVSEAEREHYVALAELSTFAPRHAR